MSTLRLPKPKKPELQKLAANPVWRSADGKKVIVSGPFPYGFFRSMTRPTVEALQGMGAMYKTICARKEATKGYAYTLSKFIIETKKDWGPVSL